MIIGEKISITVVYKGKKYRSVFDINTDGSYDDVCRVAADIVKRAWQGLEIEKFYWNYID
jgi:hypothetical protein